MSATSSPPGFCSCAPPMPAMQPLRWRWARPTIPSFSPTAVSSALPPISTRPAAGTKEPRKWARPRGSAAWRCWRTGETGRIGVRGPRAAGLTRPSIWRPNRVPGVTRFCEAHLMNSRICHTGGSRAGRAVAFCGVLLAIPCLAIVCLAIVCTAPAASADDATACAEVSYLKDVAIAACTRLIESRNLHGADLARVYSYRGRARLWASNPRDFDPAMADHDEAVRLAPGLASVYVNRALAWVRLGRGERAGEDIEKAIALAPDDAEAYFTRAEMYRYTAARREQVISDYGKAFALDPDYADAYYGQGTLLFDTDFDRAIADYTRIIERKPDWQDGSAYRARAVVYAAKGDDRDRKSTRL